MYSLRIYNRYSEDNWYSEYEYLTKEECYNFLERNYASSMEDPDTPYYFEIIDYHGNKEVL